MKKLSTSLPSPSRFDSARPRRHVEGFSIIEILVAISILGVLLVVVNNLFLSSARLNTQSRGTLDQTTVAQRLMESVQGAWAVADSVNYDKACAPVTVPSGYTVRYIDLNSRATPLVAGSTGTAIRANSGNATINCAGAAVTVTTPVPPMRRIVVSAATGSPPVTLQLDVVRPQ